MKIALWHIFSRDELKSLVESSSDVLSTIREDESLEWHLSSQTVSRINNELASSENNYQFISSTTDEDHVLIMIVADDISNNALSEMISINGSNVDLANDIMDDYYGSFRFSANSARVISSIEDAIHTHDVVEEDGNSSSTSDVTEEDSSDEEVRNTPNQVSSSDNNASFDIPSWEGPTELTNEQSIPSQRPVSNNHRTSTITVGEFIARLQALNLPDAKIYNQYYREGNFVEYGMPEIGICNEARTNIDNENEVFEAGHVIIF